MTIERPLQLERWLDDDASVDAANDAMKPAADSIALTTARAARAEVCLKHCYPYRKSEDAAPLTFLQLTAHH